MLKLMMADDCHKLLEIAVVGLSTWMTLPLVMQAQRALMISLMHWALLLTLEAAECSVVNVLFSEWFRRQLKLSSDISAIWWTAKDPLTTLQLVAIFCCWSKKLSPMVSESLQSPFLLLSSVALSNLIYFLLFNCSCTFLCSFAGGPNFWILFS